MENYDENKWNEFYIKYADEYIDTCKTDLPITRITFCKPFDYKPYYEDLRDLDPLYDHAIISISYTNETLYKKFPDIWTIQIWDHGKARSLYIQTSDRSIDKGYYDSSGRLKTDFIKEIDKRFNTHFNDSVFVKPPLENSVSH